MRELITGSASVPAGMINANRLLAGLFERGKVEKLFHVHSLLGTPGSITHVSFITSSTDRAT